MCGGIVAALIYDFLLCPRPQNFSTRRNVLLHGPEDDNHAGETPGEGNSSPGPSQWPKHWTTCNILAFLSASTPINNIHPSVSYTAYPFPQTTYGSQICSKYGYWLYFYFCSVCFSSCFYHVCNNNIIIKILFFYPVSVFSSQTIFSFAKFRVRSTYPYLHYPVTRIMQCIYRYVWLWRLCLYNVSHTVYSIILFKVFGDSPKNLFVVQQHKDVDQVIACKSTLNSS